MNDWWTSEMPLYRALELLQLSDYELHDCSNHGWDKADPHYKHYRLYFNGSMHVGGGLNEQEVQQALDDGILVYADRNSGWIVRAR